MGRLLRVTSRRWWIAAVGLAVLVVAPGIGLMLVVLQATPPGSTDNQSQDVAASRPTLTAGEESIQAEPVAGSEGNSPFAHIADPPPPSPRRSGLVTHEVTSGEVLWQMAEQYEVRPETLLWANDIPDADLLLVGQKLVIPPEDGVLYTVRDGDRLTDVATRYGIELDAIVKANALTDADEIQSGIDIFLPGARPLGGTAATGGAATRSAGQTDASAGEAPVALPENIDALLSAGWLRTQQATPLFKTADRSSSVLHPLPAGARLERVDGARGSRLQVRDPGDGRTRQAMTGWVEAASLLPGTAPGSRELPLAYPADTDMNIAHVFAPYRSQMDGSPYAEANCGPTAVGMALEAFGVSLAPRQVRAAALDAQHIYGNNVGTLITALAQVAQQQGLSVAGLYDGAGIHRWSLDDLRAQVRLGHPVVVQVRYRSLPGRGGAYYYGDHYILVTGAVNAGFLYNDPMDFDGVGWDRVISAERLRTAMNASDQRYAYAAFAVGR
jgi:LysM repeat protein